METVRGLHSRFKPVSKPYRPKGVRHYFQRCGPTVLYGGVAEPG